VLRQSRVVVIAGDEVDDGLLALPEMRLGWT
jgi:hypothetical protein